MKLKKLSAIFLSLVMIMTFVLPLSVSAADPVPPPTPEIVIEVDDAALESFKATGAKVKVDIPIIITNSMQAEIIIKSITAGGDFTSMQIPNFSPITIVNGASHPLKLLAMEYKGIGQRLDLTVVASKGGVDTTYRFPLTVSDAIQKEPVTPPDGGNGGEVPPATDPKPYIYSMDTTVFKAGDIVPVSMKIATLDGAANDVRVKLQGPKEKENLFGFYDTTGWINLGTLYEMEEIRPYIQVSPSLANGTYPVDVIFNYFDDSGKAYTLTSTINLVVQGRSDNVLYTKSANFEKAQIGKDNKSLLKVNIMNPTANFYSNVQVSFNTEGSKGFSLYDNIRNKTISNLYSQTSGTATFGVYVDTTVATGNYPITIDMSYQDATGTTISSSEIVYVQVTRTPDAGTDGKVSTARVIISGYKTDVESIKAGQAFTLEFTLKNTSATSVKNMKVVVTSPTQSGAGANATSSAVFFPSEGSNSFYIPKIGAQGTVTNTIKLMAKQDIEPGVYPVELKLEYEDEKATPLTSEDQISFAVTQEQRLDVQAITIPTDAMMGGGIPINFQYINKGKSKISNLSVSIEGDFTLEGGSQYIGNIDPGYNDYFDNIIMPSKEGSLAGEIVLKFEDSVGTEQEKRFPITCNVTAMSMGGGDIGMPGMGDAIEPMQPDKKGGLLGTILWIGIPLLVVAAGVLAFLLIMKKRKAKKVLVEDEED